MALLCLAASNTLQIEEGELAGNWSPVLGGDGREVHVFLYDLLPGGAGYTKLVKQNLDRVLTETERLLEGCTCKSSCYLCIRHNANNFLHSSLDRRLALALLRHVRTGQPPVLTEKDRSAATVTLGNLLGLKGLKTSCQAVREGVTVPLVIERPGGGEIWVELHHALADENVLETDEKMWAVQPYLTLGAEHAYGRRGNEDGSDLDNHRVAVGVQVF